MCRGNTVDWSSPGMQPGFKEWPNKNELWLNWKLSSPVGKNRGKWTTMRPPKVPPLQSKSWSEPTAMRKQCQSLLSTLLSMAGTCSERETHTERQSMNQFNSSTPPKTVNRRKPEGEWALPSTDTIAISQRLVLFRNWLPDFDLCYGCKLNSTTTGRSAMEDWCHMRNFSPLDCKYIAGGQVGRVAPLWIVLEIVTTYTINWKNMQFWSTKHYKALWACALSIQTWGNRGPHF